ncbi:MAG TPA: hypothetical protein VHZ07_24645 [Bryobacteraceae bacterium]|jgi:hypothetical protein|nr:hypothetical protein [Bryobacteraceae bacterium]
MDASTIGILVGILGAGATILAVVITHVLSQRAGEMRANQVREEVLSKMDSVNMWVSEVGSSLSDRIAGLNDRISEVKSDLNLRISDVKTEVSAQSGALRIEIENSSKGVKELVTSELRAIKAEIIAALPARSADQPH